MLDLETVDQVKSPVSLQELLPCVDVCDIALKLFIHVFLSHMKYLIQYFFYTISWFPVYTTLFSRCMKNPIKF